MGGTHVKVLVSWECEQRKFKSGPKLTARQIVESVKLVMADWKYDVVSIGFPGLVLRNRPVAEPRNLGQGWVGFNFCAAFGCHVKLVKRRRCADPGQLQAREDAFSGLGTRLGSWTL